VAAAVDAARRVFIRPPTARDRDELLALNVASRDFLRPWIEPMTSRAAFAAYLRRARLPTERPFVVCRRDNGAIVGVGVVNVSQIFYRNLRSAYLGFYAGAPFEAQGYMREGLRLVVRHAFGALGLHRRRVEAAERWLEANIQPANRRSIRLVRRAGFRREGFSRHYLKIFGRWRDHERWAVTAEDSRR
jgi:ribosomal-protein-alanine N-acetyltransferase